jgi:WD40 repeat protein
MQSTLKSSIFQPFKPILLVLFTTWLSGCGLAETESTGQTDQSVGGALAADINAKANLSVVSSINNGISVWSLQQNRQKFNFRHTSRVSTVLLDEQQMISLSSSGYAEVWNLPTP